RSRAAGGGVRPAAAARGSRRPARGSGEATRLAAKAVRASITILDGRPANWPLRGGPPAAPCRGSLFSEDEIDDPAAAGGRAAAAAVGRRLRGAAGLFEEIGEQGEQLEAALVVDRASQGHGVWCLPGGVGIDGAEGVADYVAEDDALGNLFPLTVLVPHWVIRRLGGAGNLYLDCDFCLQNGQIIT